MDPARWYASWKEKRYRYPAKSILARRERVRRDVCPFFDRIFINNQSYDLVFGSPAMLDELPRTLLNLLLRTRQKLLDHFDEARPAYWGTYTRKSEVIRARCPFTRDSAVDYDEDSAEDWYIAFHLCSNSSLIFRSEGDDADGEDIGEEDISEQDEYDLEDDLIDDENADDSGPGKGMKVLRVQCSPLVWNMGELSSQPQWLSHFTKTSIILLSNGTSFDNSSKLTF